MRLLPPSPPGHMYPRVTSVRILAPLFNLAVGVRLLMPDPILDNPANVSYRLAAVHFRGDVFLGVGLLLYGAAMVASLYTDRWEAVPSVATWLSLVTWLLFAVDLALVNPSQLGTLVYLLVAALNGFAYWHLLLWHRNMRHNTRQASAL